MFQPASFFSELVMLRTPNKPLDRNNRVVSIYVALFCLTLAMNVAIALHGARTATLIVILAVWSVDIMIFCSIWTSKAQFISRSPLVKFVNLMETFDAESLCPFCQVIRLPQSRHCNICNMCVDRYDHHCPWVNNCVGRTNHANFYVHLLLVIGYCVTSLINAFSTLFGNEPALEAGVRVPESLI